MCVTIFAERRIKIGVLSGPESSRREGSDKFWSFARPPASPLLLEPLPYRLPKWSGTEIAKAVCDAALSGARGLVVLCPRRLSALVDAYSSRLPLVSPWGGQGALHAALVPDAVGAAADIVRGDDSFAFLYDTDTGADHLSSVFSGLLQEGSSRSPPRVEGFWRVHGPNESLAFLHMVPRNTTRVIVDVGDEGAADEVARLFSAAGREVHALWMGPALMTARRSSKVSGRSTLTKLQVASGGGVSLEDLENRWKTLDDGRGDEKDMPVSTILTHDAIRVMYSMLDQLGTEWLDLNSTADEDCFNFTAGLPEGDTLDMQTLSGSGVTGPLKFDENGKRAGYTLDVIETNSFGSRKVGTWSRSSGLRWDRMQAEEQAQRLKREVPIRVTSVINRPFLTVKPGNQLEGYIPDLVEALRNVTGRPFVLVPVKDGRYGYKLDGRWVGMIGEVLFNPRSFTQVRDDPRGRSSDGFRRCTFEAASLILTTS
ncbi:hypothetical protein JTE90_000799 [Oedothorax gibbosus]|uniref:Ionotropic glutamate receptor L-glutamate and glycine-binding domain-containing protein n=1 Tax=Oedothorax gibbosus TaxID=931172 RepID=A0AAV6U1Q8_9ARAC|nr:hypothetical protein JTE90_000799 [Oedothorax gibbosus]